MWQQLFGCHQILFKKCIYKAKWIHPVCTNDIGANKKSDALPKGDWCSEHKKWFNLHADGLVDLMDEKKTKILFAFFACLQEHVFLSCKGANYRSVMYVLFGFILLGFCRFFFFFFLLHTSTLIFPRTLSCLTPTPPKMCCYFLSSFLVSCPIHLPSSALLSLRLFHFQYINFHNICNDTAICSAHV